jgi:hypothetical protein
MPTSDPGFMAVVDAYDRGVEEWKTRRHVPDKPHMRPEKWPRTLHYQFKNYKRENKVGIELHLESDGLRELGKEHLKPLGGEQLVPGIVMKWDPRWDHNRGRLLAKVGKNHPDVCVRAMQALIARTRHIVENYLKTREVESIA